MIPHLFVGIDASLNHGAIVVLREDASLFGFFFYDPTKKGTDLPRSVRGAGTRLPAEIAKHADPDVRSVSRLRWLESWFVGRLRGIGTGARELYVGVESYAVRAEHGSHALGEIGAVVRLAVTDDILWNLRLHDPTTLKMMITGIGNASKDEMRAEVAKRWIDWSLPQYGGDRTSENTQGDLADATGLAMAVLMEWKARHDVVFARSLDEGTARAFNRTTKHNPVGLLGRSWTRGSMPGC